MDNGNIEAMLLLSIIHVSKCIKMYQNVSNMLGWELRYVEAGGF